VAPCGLTTSTGRDDRHITLSATLLIGKWLTPLQPWAQAKSTAQGILPKRLAMFCIHRFKRRKGWTEMARWPCFAVRFSADPSATVLLPMATSEWRRSRHQAARHFRVNEQQPVDV